MTLRLALAYWAAIFALGFVLGTLRVLWVAPALGELAAVLLELPVMLGASWLLARRLVLGRNLGAQAALAMGALAFALLMASEAALVAVVFGNPLSGWIAGMGEPAGAIGLAGQVAFGLLPWWVSSSAARAPWPRD